MEIIIGIGVVLVAIVIAVQVLIRKQYVFETNLAPDEALRQAARAVGGGSSFLDAVGNLSIPHGGGLLSVAVDPAPERTGTVVQVWLSEYSFLNANGFDVLRYRGLVKRIRRSVGA